MYLDKFTEIISHFAGQFHIASEQTRLKELYEEFAAARKAAHYSEELPDTDVNVKVQYELIDYSPAIPYVPVSPELFVAGPHGPVPFTTVDVRVPTGIDIAYPGFIMPSTSGGGSASTVQLQLPPPGSVAIYVNQVIKLSDNDYVGAGGHGLAFTPGEHDGAALKAMVDKVANLSPIDDLTIVDGNVAGFITSAAEQFRSIQEDPGDGVTIDRSERLDGVYVNGEQADEAPDLKDYTDFLDDDDADMESGSETAVKAEGPDAHVDAQGELQTDASVELIAGCNTLVNSSVITNSWANSSVIAVVGDSAKLNAIVQINYQCDADSIGETVNGWSLGSGDTAGDFNIAMFKHIEPEQDPMPAGDVGDFPDNWLVTEIDGDLTITNWIEQFSFVSDNDVAVLSSSGVKTTIGTGENTAINDVSIEELGSSYDLIVVGGSLYDANIIQQYNILLDNDIVGAVAGFETTGQGAVSTGSNLTWNQAAIAEVGGNATPEIMPAHYLTTAKSLAGDDDDVDAAVLKDAAFEGLDTLRVLYVSGDIVNLNSIKQTNILGDSDQVALAMNKFVPRADAEWTLSTGQDQLINFATIVDVDAFGKSYVGGQHYSDEVIFQANLMADEAPLGGRDPDALVNEAVAFLSDEPDEPIQDYGYGIQPTMDHSHGDSMLG